MDQLWWQDNRVSHAAAALLVDRDGVINRKIDGGYVLDYDRDFRFIPEFLSCARRFSEAQIPIVVISNQSCIGRGLACAQALTVIMDRMIRGAAAAGVRISGYAICPHSPQDRCACRKPAAGLLQSAAARFQLRLWNCPFIGDSATDMEAAHAAGCPGMLVDANDPIHYRDTFREAFSYMCARIAA